jgi:iron complex transport system permease protein
VLVPRVWARLNGGLSEGERILSLKADKGFAWGLVLTAVILGAMFFTSGIGPFRISYGTLVRLWATPFDASLSAGIDDSVRYIALHVRLARVCLALAVGAGLAMAGAVYQGVLLNPLADPFTLGVSTGAAFGACVAILLGWTGTTWMGINLLPAAAFAGALAALYGVYLLGRMEGRLQSTTLVLAGIIVSTFLSALISLLKSLNEDSVSTIVFWIMGSLSGRNWAHVALVWPYLMVGGAVILFHARELDLLSLGDAQAQQMGVDVGRVRFRLLLAASLITGATVAVSGVVGFVGLVVPHVVRLSLGPVHRRLLPLVMLAGGLLVLVADTLARSILPGGEELPVGVVTAILGGPFFCYLMLHRKTQIRL